MKRLLSLLACVAAALGAGCAKSAPPAASAAWEPTAAQPALPGLKLWLGPEVLKAEVAATFEQQATGMMFRTNLADDGGMLFIRPAPERASFWMHHCPLPLAVAYIDAGGTILEEHEMKAWDTNSTVSQAVNVRFVLEVNKGWFDRHHIPVGTLITTEHGSLPDVFLRPQQ